MNLEMNILNIWLIFQFKFVYLLHENYSMLKEIKIGEIYKLKVVNNAYWSSLNNAHVKVKQYPIPKDMQYGKSNSHAIVQILGGSWPIVVHVDNLIDKI